MFLRLFQKIIRLSFQTIMKTIINIENKKKNYIFNTIISPLI